jgi:DNA repair protein RadA/Sms
MGWSRGAGTRYTRRMAKTKTQFLCSQCGESQPTWAGKCPACGAWDSLEPFTETPIEDAPAHEHDRLASSWRAGIEAGPRPLSDIDPEEVARIPTGVAEFDRVLGGGFVQGSVVLLGGDPGIGKSTLLLQAAIALASQSTPILYVTSEEVGGPDPPARPAADSGR